MADSGELVGLIREDQDPFGVAVAIHRVLEQLRTWKYPVYLHPPGALHAALVQGTTEQVRSLLTRCADVNERRDGFLPLHLAAWYGRVEEASLLLARGAQVDARQPEYRYHSKTALHLAAEKNHRRIAEILLQNKADITAKSAVSWPPIQYAVHAGSVDAALLLLEHGADPNTGDDFYEGLLGAAVAKKNVAMVNALLKHGASVKWPDPAPLRTPLHQAAEDGSAEIVAALVAHGAKVDHTFLEASRYTPLQLAVQKSSYVEGRDPYLKVVQILLANGADASRGSVDIAISDGHVEIANALLARGAKIGEGTLCSTIRNGSLKMLEALLASGVPVNRVYNDHSSEITPLGCAALYGKVDAVRALLKAGADVNLEGKDGSTPLTAAVGGLDAADGKQTADYLAVAEVLLKAGAHASDVKLRDLIWLGPTQLLELLLAYGADANAPFLTQMRKEVTPLEYAVEGGRTNAVRALIKAGAKVNLANKDGETPIHVAISGAEEAAPEVAEFAAIIKLLLQAGADVNARDEDGMTPLARAEGNRSNLSEIVAVLRASGGKR